MTATKNRRLSIFLATACVAMMAFQVHPVVGQMINVQTPLQANRDTYFNRTGLGFGMNFAGNDRIRGLNVAGQILPRIQITQGSAGAAIPGFGGFTPNSPLRTGFTTIGGDLGLSFSLVAGKGSRRSSVSQTPSVTLMNGQTGSIFSGSQVPFVTRIDPVFGMGGMGSSLLRQPSPGYMESSAIGSPTNSRSLRSYSNANSSAGQSALSIADIQRQKQLGASFEDQELRAEVDGLISQAETLVAQRNYGAARAKFGRAIRRIADRPDFVELHDQLKRTLAELKNKR